MAHAVYYPVIDEVCYTYYGLQNITYKNVTFFNQYDELNISLFWHDKNMFTSLPISLCSAQWNGIGTFHLYNFRVFCYWLIPKRETQQPNSPEQIPILRQKPVVVVDLDVLHLFSWFFRTTEILVDVLRQIRS